MAKVLIEESTLTDIGNAIRTKKGTSGLIPTPNMKSEILSISGGDTSIDGGYTVNFYDLDSALIETHSAKFGNQIGSPLSYDVPLWKDADGNKTTFPLTVTEDMDIELVELFASNGMYTDKLYHTFGINPEEYPVTFIKQSIQSNEYKGACAIYFTKGIARADSSHITITSPIRGNIYAYTTSTDTKTVVDAVCGLINEEGFTLNSVSTNNSTLEHNFYVNTNQKLNVTSGKWYDLNLDYGDETVELT